MESGPGGDLERNKQDSNIEKNENNDRNAKEITGISINQYICELYNIPFLSFCL